MVTPCGVSNQVRLGRKEMKSMGKDEIEFIHEDMRIDDLEDKEQQKRIYKLFDVMLGDLIIRYSKSQSYGENGKILNDDYYDIPFALREILRVPQTTEINNSIKSIKTAIENLEAKFRNHRHPLDKTF